MDGPRTDRGDAAAAVWTFRGGATARPGRAYSLSATRRTRRAPRPQAPTRHVLLIRHGQYDESSREDARRILTPLGRDQAVATGLRLSELINSGAPGSRIRIQSSGLARAIETAALIEPHLPDRTEALPPDGDLNEGRPAQVIPGRAYSNAAVRADGSRIEAAFKKIFKRAEPRADGGLHEHRDRAEIVSLDFATYLNRMA